MRNNIQLKYKFLHIHYKLNLLGYTFLKKETNNDLIYNNLLSNFKI